MAETAVVQNKRENESIPDIDIYCGSATPELARLVAERLGRPMGRRDVDHCEIGGQPPHYSRSESCGSYRPAFTCYSRFLRHRDDSPDGHSVARQSPARSYRCTKFGARDTRYRTGKSRGDVREPTQCAAGRNA